MPEKRPTLIPRTPPVCKYCTAARRVHSVKLKFTHDSVEYWQCATCKRHWTERQGRPHIHASKA
jgi:transposase-like protein